MNIKHLHKILIGAAALGLVMMGFAVGTIINVTQNFGPFASSRPSYEQVLAAGENGQSLPGPGVGVLEAWQQTYRDISERVMPAVVQVEVTKEVKASRQPFPFRFFDGDPDSDPSQPQIQGGFGSGIIVDRKGDTLFVMTNNHVVDGGDKLVIRTSDHREFKGSLVGTDPKRDIAVIKFDSSDKFSIAKLGDSTRVRSGDIVFAIGSPYGIQNTITQGIISAVGRTDNDFRATGGAASGFTDYLQTDAAINQGNSGGALVNIYGEVIGVNTWIASRNGGNVGLAFSVPINNAKKVAFDLMSKGKVEYGWLGVSGMDLADNDSKSLNIKNGDGAFVGSVFWDSPAFKAGIRPGDLLTKFADQKLTSSTDLVRAVSGSDPNKAYSASIIRNGQAQEIKVTLGVRNDSDLTKMSAWPGFPVTGVTSDLQKKVKGTVSIGQVMIANVEPNSAADEVGLRPMDVITSVNGQTVNNLGDYYRALANAKGKELQLKLINRAGRDVSVTYQP